MKADTASPATPPTPAPVGGPQPVVPVPGATTPPTTHHHHGPAAEPNALLEGTKKLWSNLKAGKVGNPKIIALVLAVVAILVAWWFLSDASLKNDSALWAGFDGARNQEQLQTFAEEPSQSDTLAGKIAKLNAFRLQRDAALAKLTNRKRAERVEGANTLEKLRDEFTGIADQFGSDPTLKASAYLAAAEIEIGLVGVPQAGVMAMGGDEKGKGRGKLEKYAELMKKAAEAIGPETEAGKELIAKGEKYSDETEAAQLYRQLGLFHAKFNEPDPTTTSTPDPNAPKAPEGIGGNPTPPTGTPGDTPKPPEGNPFDGDKK